MDFAKSIGPGHQDIFTPRQAATVNRAIDTMAPTPGDRTAIGKFLVRYADHRAALEIRDLFTLLCYTFNQPQYRVDKDLNIIEEPTDGEIDCGE